jgi:hypothetical protein
MKKVKTPRNAVIACILLTILICGCTQNQNATKSRVTPQTISEATPSETGQKWLTYDNPGAGIKMKYPVGWKVGPLKSNFTDHYPDAYLLLLKFQPETYNASSDHRESVFVRVQDLVLNESYTLDLMLYELKKDQPDLVVLEASSNYTLSSNHAVKIAYGAKTNLTGIKGEYDYIWMLFWTVKNNRVYVFSYSAPKDRYPMFTDTINEMIDSFTISDTVPQTTSEVTISDTGKKWLTYENQERGIKIDYPSDWDVDENLPGNPDVVFFGSRSDDPSDEFIENLAISFQDLSGKPMNQSEYTEHRLLTAIKGVTDYELLESSDNYTLSSNPAHKRVQTGKYDGFASMKWMEIWTVKNDKAYSLAYMAEEDKYSKYIDTVNEMIDSFTITK